MTSKFLLVLQCDAAEITAKRRFFLVAAISSISGSRLVIKRRLMASYAIREPELSPLSHPLILVRNVGSTSFQRIAASLSTRMTAMPL